MSILKGLIYKQQYDEVIIESLHVDISKGQYQTIECHDCKGTGIFWITNVDKQKCVECKSSGLVWVNIY